MFVWASRDGHEPPRPFNTFIRVDVAHQMAAVSRWKCIANVRHSVVKGFYLRSVALMIDAQSVQEFERLFRLTCLVALHEDESKNIILSGTEITILEARQRLENDMAERREMIENLEISRENVQIEDEVDKTLNHNNADEKCEQKLTATHRWIKELISRSTPDDEHASTCTAVNGFYFPEFVPQLERIGKDFPLWSAACLPTNQGHASTGGHEKYHSEIKRKIFECTAPRFLQEHINDLQCGANEIASKLKHYNHKHKVPLSCPDLEKIHSEPALEKSVDTRPQMNKRLAANAKKTALLAPNSFQQKSIISTVSPVDVSFQNTGQSPGFQNAAQSSTPITKTTLSKLESSGSFDFGSVSLLYNKATTVNDSDLKSDETWKGLVNEDIFMGSDEPNLECQEDEHFFADTSNQAFDLKSDRRTDFGKNDSLNDPNNNIIVSDQQNKDTSLLDHSYSKLISDEDSPGIYESVQRGIDFDCNKNKPFEWDNNRNSTPREIEKDSMVIKNESTVHENDQQNSETKCVKKKAAKVGYYFQSYRQVRFVNEKLQVGGRKGCLLKNGSKLGIVKINDVAVDLQETCGFDAIMNLLQFGAINNRGYHSFIKSSNNKALKFLSKFIEMGPSVAVLKERVILLNEFYPLLENPDAPSIKVFKLNVHDSITTLWKHLFCSEPAEPSATKSRVCSNPHCIQSLSTDIPYFGVNIKKINSKGIQALQEAVIFHETLWNVKCRQKGCRESVTETIRPNVQIFIDLDSRTLTNPNKMVECKLTDIPVSLKFTKEYRYVYMYR